MHQTDLYIAIAVSACLAFGVLAYFFFGVSCPHCRSRKWKREISRRLLSERMGQERRDVTSTSTGVINGRLATSTKTQTQHVPVLRQEHEVTYLCTSCDKQLVRTEETKKSEF
ncbi:hypothetical protein [Octadecabacter ascidiaceicola]|uniref:Uncharacterized protein n=1 Tax=Octadecabacter ascidiaceicola TaxID=1655543 RepID=A0A238K9A9_9RHOB|nr:hypothetical protein [Octadecabacter ascidiaceicola]SMX39403.1 hypothetical protein OCA8868_01959 [Octadecabacter ascidiaceicola]